MVPKDILKTIEQSGYEAYIVGGYVRDYLLGIKSHDIDITTSMTPQKIKSIFQNVSQNKYGVSKLEIYPFTYDITTYRKEKEYHLHHPKKIIYINNLLDDLKRRDFTVNAICLDSNNNIIDPLGGKKDLKNRLIKVIGKTDEKLLEDPLRILRAIRFASIYDFNLDSEIVEFIINHGYLLRKISFDRRIIELNKILSNKNYLIGLNLLKNLNLLNDIGINYSNINYVDSLAGMWAQLEIDKNYRFTKEMTKKISSIKSILELKKISIQTLYKYGLDNNLIAAKILNIDESTVLQIWNQMGLHNKKELNISKNFIQVITENGLNSNIKVIKEDLINKILSGNLSNEENVLIDYVYKKWK